jgi:hypothetical protein
MSAEPVVPPAAAGGLPSALQLVRAPGTGPPEADRRRTDPLGALSRRLDDLCTQAVDAGEIAAGLEARGFTDAQVQRTYNLPDVFALADTLFHLVPRRGARTAAADTADPWRLPASRLVLRGLLFALPGLLYVSALPAYTSAPDVIVLAAGLLGGWGAGQGCAYLGHVLRGRRQIGAARSWLSRCVLSAVGVAAIAGVDAVAAGADVQAVLVAAGLIVYMVAAAAVLVEQRERLLLVVLMPGVAASGLLLVPGGKVWAAAGAGVTLLLLVLLALFLCGPDGIRPRPRDLPRHAHAAPALGDVIAPADRRAAAWQVAYGLLVGVAVTVPQALGGGMPNATAGAAGAAVLPLVCSSGTAEWLVHRVRRRGMALARVQTGVRAFGARMRWELLFGLAVHAAVAALVAVAVSRGAAELPDLTGWRPPVPDRALLAAYALAAVGLAAALTAMSCGAAARVVVHLAVALAAGLAVSLAFRAELAPVLPLVVPALVTAVMTRLALRAVLDPQLHA